MAVTKKERVWLEEYLQCWNGTEAARRAGYKWPDRIGTQKMTKFADQIQARIAEKVMSADEALVRLSEIARGTWAEYLGPTGSVDIAGMVEDGKAHLISKVADNQYGKRIEFCDMQGALNSIGKKHGLFIEKHEVTGKDGGPLQTEDVTGLSDSELDRIIAQAEGATTRSAGGEGEAGEGPAAPA